MTFSRATVFVAMLAAAMMPSCACAHDRAAEADILKIEHEIAAARTVSQIARYFDPHVVLYDFMPPTIRGISAFTAHVNDVFATMPSFEVQIIEMDVNADTKLAFANSVQRVIVRDKAGHVTLDGIFRNTNCYHKVNGRWLIEYEHISFPVNLVTGKVILTP